MANRNGTSEKSDETEVGMTILTVREAYNQKWFGLDLSKPPSNPEVFYKPVTDLCLGVSDRVLVRETATNRWMYGRDKLVGLGWWINEKLIIPDTLPLGRIGNGVFSALPDKLKGEILESRLYLFEVKEWYEYDAELLGFLKEEVKAREAEFLAPV
jgi:hypothetical protein